jgi:hypothetical protein
MECVNSFQDVAEKFSLSMDVYIEVF